MAFSDGNVATKNDVIRLESKIENTGAKLESKLDRIENRLISKLEGLNNINSSQMTWLNCSSYITYFLLGAYISYWFGIFLGHKL